jgi:hypothetical protein
MDCAWVRQPELVPVSAQLAAPVRHGALEALPAEWGPLLYYYSLQQALEESIRPMRRA